MPKKLNTGKIELCLKSSKNYKKKYRGQGK